MSVDVGVCMHDRQACLTKSSVCICVKCYGQGFSFVIFCASHPVPPLDVILLPERDNDAPLLTTRAGSVPCMFQSEIYLKNPKGICYSHEKHKKGMGADIYLGKDGKVLDGDILCIALDLRVGQAKGLFVMRVRRMHSCVYMHTIITNLLLQTYGEKYSQWTTNLEALLHARLP
jgi:hypothetical protein